MSPKTTPRAPTTSAAAGAARGGARGKPVMPGNSSQAPAPDGTRRKWAGLYAALLHCTIAAPASARREPRHSSPRPGSARSVARRALLGRGAAPLYPARTSQVPENMKLIRIGGHPAPAARPAGARRAGHRGLSACGRGDDRPGRQPRRRRRGRGRRSTTTFYEISPRDKVAASVRTRGALRLRRAGALRRRARLRPEPRAISARPSRAATTSSPTRTWWRSSIDPLGTRKFAHFVRANPRGVDRRRPLQRGHRQRGLLAGLRGRRGHGALRGRLDGGIPHPVLVASLHRPAECRVERARLPQLPARPALPHRLEPAAARLELLPVPEPAAHRALDDLPSTRHLAVTPQLTVRGTRDRTGAARERARTMSCRASTSSGARAPTSWSTRP